MRVVLFTLMALACSASAPAAVYRWVDANGTVHYSDQPQPGAAKVQVAPVQTYQAPTAAAAGPTDTDPSSSDSGAGAVSTSCFLLSPTSEEVLSNTSSVTGRVQLAAPLNAGDRILVVLDGSPREVGSDGSGSFTLSGLERGTHTLAARVQTLEGQQRCQTQTVTFYVRQPSVQSPTSPVHPH